MKATSTIHFPCVIPKAISLPWILKCATPDQNKSIIFTYFYISLSRSPRDFINHFSWIASLPGVEQTRFSHSFCQVFPRSLACILRRPSYFRLQNKTVSSPKRIKLEEVVKSLFHVLKLITVVSYSRYVFNWMKLLNIFHFYRLVFNQSPINSFKEKIKRNKLEYIIIWIRMCLMTIVDKFSTSFNVYNHCT